MTVRSFLLTRLAKRVARQAGFLYAERTALLPSDSVMGEVPRYRPPETGYWRSISHSRRWLWICRRVRANRGRFRQEKFGCRELFSSPMENIFLNWGALLEVTHFDCGFRILKEEHLLRSAQRA